MSPNTEQIAVQTAFKKSRAFKGPKANLIRDDYDFQYGENNTLKVVKVGETDIVKEINSHAGEVGLVNVIKNAALHGTPLTAFAKTDDGVPVAVDENITMAELMEQSKANAEKYKSIADSLGVTVAQLQEAVKNGTLDQLINKPKDEEVKEDGANS